ncbi:MAG: hypothetical protein N4A59_12570, partial [Marinifilum sp.]|nr:hypothetical protein [Marinifilum sp.]
MKIFRITIYFVILSLMCIKLYGQNNTKSQKDKKSTSEAEAAATRAAIIGEEGCVRFVSPSSVSIPQSGGYKQIYVELNEASCNYIVSESASWISIQDRGNTVFKIYCTPNTGTSTRTHSVNVDGKSIYVSQAGISINTYNVTGGGAYCYGESGVNVGLNGSQSGASYTLKRNGGTVKTLSGTGGAIDFGKQISAGTYTVTASISGMNKNMSGSANVTVKSSPQGFSVSGGGTLTVCDPNTSINLSDSETGKIYTLYKGGSVQGTQIGNGNAISWSNITAAGTYTITAEYNGCTRNMSGSASVNIQPVLTSGSINGVKTICHNNSAGTLGNSSSATGGFGTYNYQWQVSSNNSSWNNVSGATGTNYSPGNLTSSKYYRRRVQDGCDTKYTPSVKVTVRSALAAGNINGAKTISYNASAGTLGNSNSASGGTGNYSYQWQVSTNNSSWTSISGATGTTYSPGNLSNSRYYRRRASDNGGCGTVYTSSVKVSVTPTSGSIASNQTINYNASASTLTSASSPAGGNGSYSYQWQSSTNNSSWSNISGATGSTYSPGTLTGSKYYRRRIYSDGNYAYSSSVKITVRPTSGSIASNQTINYNASASTLTSASSPAGGNGSYFYQCQSSTNNSSWNNISGATGSSYSPGSLTSARYYRRMGTSEGNSAHSSSVKITVRPTSGSIASNQTINY